MKASLNWVNDYLDQPVEIDEMQEVLTRQGLPVEDQQSTGDDVVFNVEITSNRCDCQCHVGLAREVAAGLERQVREPQCDLGVSDAPSQQPDVHAWTNVENHNQTLCPVYTARLIAEVKIGKSPDWLIQRLDAIGLRSVNNVVDITNFVLFELGQPLHAFDLARLEEKRIVVRCAEEGESFTAIDGSKHSLTREMLVIADAKQPVAIAGVMGGLDSEVGEQSTNLLLESAIFDPLSVRNTSRKLKLASDSSFRFERGVDPLGVERASRRAAQLIVDLAGGTLVAGMIRVGQSELQPHEVKLRIERCRRLLGVDIDPPQIMNLLERLGLGPTLDDAYTTVTCTIPTHRLDLNREVDLIEEVSRLHGLDRVPVGERIEIVAKSPRNEVSARQKLGQILIAHGYHETITISFLHPRFGHPFLAKCPFGHMSDQSSDEGKKNTAVVVSDGLHHTESMLRSSLVPSLLLCRKTNQDVGNSNLALFETASSWVHRQSGEHGKELVETQSLALMKDAPDVENVLRSMRGTLDELVGHLLNDPSLAVTPIDGGWLAQGMSFTAKDQAIGMLGLISRPTQELFDLQLPVIVGEFDLSYLLGDFPPQRQVRALPRFPGIVRDLSIILDEQIPWVQIEAHVRKCNPALLEQLEFLGVYRGKPITVGQKSVSFRMLFRDPQRTLRHEQVDDQVASVVDLLAKHLGAELRS